MTLAATPRLAMASMEDPVTCPQLALTDTDLATAAVDAIIVGTVQGQDGLQLAPGADTVASAFGGGLVELLGILGATGKADEVVKLPTNGLLAAPVLVATGLGRPDPEGRCLAEQVRRASGAATRALPGIGNAVNTLAAVDLGAAAEGASLGAYTFTAYRSENGDRPLARVELPVGSAADGASGARLREATVVAEAVAIARDFVNTPPNDLYPASFAERAAGIAGELGLAAEVLDEKALRKAG